MKRLAIIGAGDLGRQIAHHVNDVDDLYVTLFFDDTIPKNTQVGGVLVAGGLADVSDAFERDAFDVLFVAVGYHHFDFRQDVFNRFSQHIPFASIIHPSVALDRSSKMGGGVFIHPGCSLGMNAVIGDNVLIYNGTHIAHDSSVGAHSIVAPGVTLAGNCSIGQRVFLGVGTTVSDGVVIGDDVSTGAGAVLVSDLTEPGVYVGCPARFLRKR